MKSTHFIDKEPNMFQALTELQKRDIQSMNEDEILEDIEEFEFKWYLHNKDGYSPCMKRATMLGYHQ